MDDKDWIAGAAKALAIIEAFDEEHARMTPTMVAARRPVAHGRASLSADAARTRLRRHRWQAVLAKVLTPYTYSTVERLREVLGEIRRNGYVVTDQQLEIGVRGVAVPLRDRHGTVVAAISVSMPTGEESANAALHRVLPALQETASLLRNLV